MNQVIYKGVLFTEPNKPVNGKRKYRGKISYDTRNGKLKRLPCEICGDENADAHHETYGDEPVIRWLCHKHHQKIHALLRDNKRGNNEDVGIICNLPKEFSLELDQYILDLKRTGVRISKADLIIKFARMQFNRERNNE